MPVFQYKAHDKRSNKEVSDTIEAPSQMEAIASIKRQGMLPIEVKEAKAKSGKAGTSAAKGSGGGGGGFGRIKPKVVTLFTRQLSTLQDAGLPIVQSLQILTDMQRPGKFKGSLGTVTEDVQSGTMLSEAMSRHPKIWDKLYTNLVRAGETAGALDVILRRLAEFREKAERLKKKVH
jgi:type IV pilus assembly protein PilC